MEKQAYYTILQLNPNASTSEIKAAISRLRKKDINGDYAATLVEMERTLLDETGPVQNNNAFDGFLDIEQDDLLSRKHRLERDERGRKNNPYSSLKKGKKPKISRGPKVLMWFITTLIFIGIAFVAALFAGKPLYQYYLANQQAKSAAEALFAAKENVEQEIRKNKVFPQEMTFPAPSDGSYQIRLLADEKITLVFTPQAIPALQGHSMTLTSDTRPNMGLIWRCDVDPGFPQNLHPAKCY